MTLGEPPLTLHLDAYKQTHPVAGASSCIGTISPLRLDRAVVATIRMLAGATMGLADK
jgi:hypothetical protein